jgi:hypothetical protein
LPNFRRKEDCLQGDKSPQVLDRGANAAKMTRESSGRQTTTKAIKTHHAKSLEANCAAGKVAGGELRCRQNRWRRIALPAKSLEAKCAAGKFAKKR